MPNIHNDTPLVPYLIAESIVQDRNAVTYLVKKSERIYECSLHFRTLISDKKSDCREVLRMFMNHWLQGFNLKNHKK